MAQITWRNIDAPNLGEALRPLMGAQQSFGGAVDSLAKVLANREATDTANWQTQKANNTQAALDAIFKFKTPEELAAARASGALDQTLASFGNQIDRSQVRGAADTRLDALYQQTQHANAFADAQEERLLRPLVQQAKGLAAQGKADEVNALMSSNPRLAQRYGGELVAAGVIGERDAIKFAQGNVKFADDLQTSDVRRRTDLMNSQSQRISANASATSAGASVMNAETNRKELAARTEERLQKQLAETMAARSAAGMTIASPEGAKYVVDELSKTVKDPKALQRLQVALGEIASDKDLKNVSPQAALMALVGDQSTGLGIRKIFWDGTGDGAASALKDIMKSPDFKAQLERQNLQYQQIDRRVQELRLALGMAPEPLPDAKPTPKPADAPSPATSLLSTPAGAPTRDKQLADELNAARRKAREQLGLPPVAEKKTLK